MRNRNIWRVAAVLLSFTLIATACGDSGSDTGNAAATTTAAATSDGSSATTAAPGATTAPSDTVAVVQDGDLLQTVLDRGTLNCGVSGAAVAFSETKPDGSTTGFDADYCRYLAAALFGDANAVVFTALTAAARFTAVQTGEVDVLIRNTTWTQSRDGELAMDFAPTTFYDGQQIMARESDGFDENSTIQDLEGAIVCTNAGTTTEKNIAAVTKALGVNITLNTFEDYDIVMDNFKSGACDAVTTDGSGLVGRRANDQPADQVWSIFPTPPISKEPLGPAYLQGNPLWADVVNWSVYSSIIFDEKGVTSANAADMAANPPDAEIGRLTGGDGELQTAMGLPADAWLNAVSQVGNYDEIYTRNLVPVGLERAGTANAGWLDGGLIYSPPAH